MSNAHIPPAHPRPLCRTRAIPCVHAFPTRGRDARGFSIIEFLLVSVPILLLTLGGVEAAHWYHVRQMVDLALVEAARAGATHNARPEVMAQAFEQALQPLFVGTSPRATHTRLTRTLDARSHAMGNAPPWQIRILRPNAHDYAQFSDPNLAIARASGLPTIRNDYQYEQQRRRAPSGADKDSIFAANTLELRLVYPHSPLIPGVAHLLAGLQAPSDAYAQDAFAAGLLPMVRDIQLDMASHPVAWPSLPDGRVIQGSVIHTSTVPRQTASCVGLWCNAQARTPPQPPATTPPSPEPVQTENPVPAPEADWDEADWDRADGTQPDDPLCS